MTAAPGLADRLEQTDLILPIPLSQDKLRQRGYNQAWELCKALRRQHAAPPAHAGLLQRRHLSQAQHELPRGQRIAHAMQAYFVAPAARPPPGPVRAAARRCHDDRCHATVRRCRAARSRRRRGRRAGLCAHPAPTLD